ncbi:hypothetical protein [Flavobacterium pectinovorum]|uniref:Uncharacterized protein n=1 Tax=Flavobacterium pectinovorum TaxID=29533 RepID=A0A502F081_9FLAO|nr:hypothetical protein [Flavobacterium pectinovorum]TPG42026.1 hypothetical protein EAH81_06795 [Flavobacterium pectinovorum]
MKKHYQKYCMHLTYAIISSSTFLFTTKTFSQEKLKITPEFSKQIIEKYQVESFKIFPVTIKAFEDKSIIYVMSENPVELNVLSGDFIKLPDNYMLSNKEIPNRFMKNELFTEKNESYQNLGGTFDRFPIIKKISTDELFYVMSNKFMGQLEVETDQFNFKNLGNTVEYKTWKTKYLTLLQSAQTNVNTCNAIIKKHTYLNRLGQKRYDSDKFTKQEKLSFNKNLDSLNEKLKTIGDLEDNRDFLAFYNNKVSTVEATKSYALSSFYNSTSRSY